MLPAYFKAFFTIFASLPGAVAGTYGLIQAAEKTGFEKVHPTQFAALVNLNNGLLWVLVEYWLGHILLSALLAFFWALIVAEPKIASKRRFQNARGQRRGQSDGK